MSKPVIAAVTIATAALIYSISNLDDPCAYRHDLDLQKTLGGLAHEGHITEGLLDSEIFILYKQIHDYMKHDLYCNHDKNTNKYVKDLVNQFKTKIGSRAAEKAARLAEKAGIKAGQKALKAAFRAQNRR